MFFSKKKFFLRNWMKLVMVDWFCLKSQTTTMHREKGPYPWNNEQMWNFLNKFLMNFCCCCRNRVERRGKKYFSVKENDVNKEEEDDLNGAEWTSGWLSTHLIIEPCAKFFSIAKLPFSFKYSRSITLETHSLSIGRINIDSKLRPQCPQTGPERVEWRLGPRLTGSP